MAKPELSQFLASLLLVLVDFIRFGNQFPLQSDTCDQTIWDSTWEARGVRHVVAGCSEGHVDWRHPYGAVRVTFQLGSGSTAMEACFKAKTHYTVAKISLELDEDMDSLETLTLLNYSHPHTPREICLQSNSSLTLYIEAQSDMNANTIGHIEIEYDIQRLHHGRLKYDNMEECRPCTEAELLTAVCSSDFVVAGSMEAVLHNPDAKETEIHVGTSKVVRQRRSVFQARKDSLSGLNSEQYFPHHAMSQGQLKGAVIAPDKCGIRHGEGEFIFIGRIRLDKAFLQCAPRREEFEHIWSKALTEERNPCIID